MGVFEEMSWGKRNARKLYSKLRNVVGFWYCIEIERAKKSIGIYYGS